MRRALTSHDDFTASKAYETECCVEATWFFNDNAGDDFLSWDMKLGDVSNELNDDSTPATRLEELPGLIKPMNPTFPFLTF